MVVGEIRTRQVRESLRLTGAGAYLRFFEVGGVTVAAGLARSDLQFLVEELKSLKREFSA